MKQLQTRLALAAAAGLLAMTPTVAWAHERSSADGFVSGLLHPLLGGDHFLAMVSVGIVSAQLGGRRIWTVPATFVLSMIVGAVAGIYGSEWPLAEQGIALSVIILGIAIATVTQKVSSLPVMIGVALFGALHGHAHGLELPNSADPIYYGAGFLASTTAIHLLGVGVGHLFTGRARFVPVLRHLGSAMAGMGLMILVSRVAE